MDNPASGVYQSARHLFLCLHEYGVKPAVLAPVDLPEPFAKFQKASGHIIIPQQVGRLKPVWPLLSRSALGRGGRWKAKPIILHGLSNINLPIMGKKESGWRWVVTVHDTIPLIKGTGLSSKLVKQYEWLLPIVLRRADAIVSVSHWTKLCLEQSYPMARGKIHVIPNGIAPLRRQALPQPASDVIRTLTVSRGEPYKRLDRLVTLFRMYPERLNCTLVTDRQGVDLIAALAPDLIDSGVFRVYTSVSPELLTTLYCNTDVYLHPSLYEGFCMPAAEAISTGKPVVYQSGSGIDEVAGDVVGVGLAAGAAEDDWLQAIETAYRRSQAPDWFATLEGEISRQPSWNQSAEALRLLYINLLKA